MGKNLERFIEMLLNTQRNWRETALTDSIGNQTIDTCYAPDTQKWETGIERDGKWIIVEQYGDEEEARKGHNKWVKKIKHSPKMPLKECQTAEEWFFG